MFNANQVYEVGMTMSTGRRDTIVACRVSDDMRDRLAELARAEDLPVSWLLRKAVRRLLAAEAKKSKRHTAEPSDLR